MGWLFNYTLASLAASFIVVKIFDYIFSEVASGLVSAARFGFFVVAWTVVTTKAGMHGFSKRVRDLRKSISVRNMP